MIQQSKLDRFDFTCNNETVVVNSRILLGHLPITFFYTNKQLVVYGQF